MPLNEKGEKIKHAMQENYGTEKGTRVFYASENKGTISGVTRGDDCPQHAYMDACMRGDSAAISGHHSALVRGRSDAYDYSGSGYIAGYNGRSPGENHPEYLKGHARGVAAAQKEKQEENRNRASLRSQGYGGSSVFGRTSR